MGLRDDANARSLTDFVDENGRAFGHLAIAERRRSGLKCEVERGMNTDQLSTTNHSELTAVFVEKRLLATIEKGGFLGCWKHAPG
jgi:hypothetical protein